MRFVVFAFMVVVLLNNLTIYCSLAPTDSFVQYINSIGALPFVVHGKKPVSDLHLIELQNEKFYRQNSVESFLDLFTFFYPHELAAFIGSREFLASIGNKGLDQKGDIIIAIESQRYPFSSKRVALINYCEVEKVLQKHKSSFKEILGGGFDEQEFLRKICLYPGDFEKFLRESVYLKGLLYGYGERNAQNFDLENRPYCCMTPPFFKTYPKKARETAAERADLYPRLESGTSLNPYLIFIPGHIFFSASPENEGIIRNYRRAYRKTLHELSHSNLNDWTIRYLKTKS